MGAILDNARTHFNSSDGKDAIEESAINDLLTGTMDPNIGQLSAWPLDDIKKFHDRYRRLCYYPIIDRLLFCKLMNLSKKNGYYLYSHLIGSGKPSKSFMSIFELLTILVILAYANFQNKLKFLFAIFDFYGKQNLGYNQWNVLVTSFFNALSRMYKLPFFDKIQIGAIAKAIFIKADIAPYDNNLEISELREWVDSCPEVIKVFQNYEPPFQIKEKPLIYYTFKPYADQHAETIYKATSRYANPKYVDPEEIKEVIDHHSKKDQPPPISPDKGKDSLARSPMFTRNNSTANFDGMNMSPKPRVRLAPLSTLASPIRGSTFKRDHLLSPESKTLPALLSPTSAQTFSKEELLKRRTEYGQKLKSIHRNVIITKGKTITKDDVTKIKYYFDTIAEGDEQLGQKHFVQHFSKFTNLQKVSASLFSFLDDKAKGFITFPELLKKLYPNLAKSEFEQLIKWSKEEENFILNKTHKRFIEEKDKATKQKLKPVYEVPREAIKKMKYIFDLYDQGKKGYVSKEDMAKKFQTMYSPQEIDKKFEEFDKDKDGYLNLKEFIEVILPSDFYLDPAILGHHV